MTDKLTRIKESFNSVYGPISKAIGDCLITLDKDKKEIDATAVISAIIGAAIDIAARANKLAKDQGNIEMLIDTDHLARFVAFTMTSTLSFSNEVRIALDKVVEAGRKPAAPTAPGSTELN